MVQVDILFRKRTHGSATNLHSHKRRRISMASVDLSREFEIRSSVDRFVPPRPKSSIPLNVTPRTRRISKQFGLADDRVFNFQQDERDPDTLDMLRMSASNLFREAPIPRSSSRRQCLLTLDSPGIPHDSYAFPISWSRRNLIADLNTKRVTHLCKVETPDGRNIHAIEWAGAGRDTLIAAGNNGGAIQVWDAGPQAGDRGKLVRMWQDSENQCIRSMSWVEGVLSVGVEDGAISLFDIRAPDVWSRTSQHKAAVLGMKWSPDGNYLASGDEKGIVHIWDKRAGKTLLDVGKKSSKMRHRGGFAWCPWKIDLLATGTTAPEGKIRIWSTNNITSAYPEPISIFPLNTSVLSLQWSPHAKELLSTHGMSFLPVTNRPRSLSNLRDSSGLSFGACKPNLTGPLTNAIAVHEYPSGKRLLTLTNAHLNPVTHSCLSPDGENVFTVCPGEETIKMWQVWGRRKVVEKRESAFEKCSIR
ncbi:WD40-repeat-containing domain protein [Cyathus striatus]|nr:WD40-repeat-containing domain protein [Cyathus striatus]